MCNELKVSWVTPTCVVPKGFTIALFLNTMYILCFVCLNMKQQGTHLKCTGSDMDNDMLIFFAVHTMYYAIIET